MLARWFWFGLGFHAFGPALGLRSQRLLAARPVVAAPAVERRDARNPVFGHDIGYGQAVLDVVARGRDLRLPVIAPVAGGSHDCLLAVGSIQQDPLFRGLPWHRKPARQRPAARPGPDGFQRLAPEPVVVMSPPIFTHTKEPHLRSSNLNFSSPTTVVQKSIAFYRSSANSNMP